MDSLLLFYDWLILKGYKETTAAEYRRAISNVMAERKASFEEIVRDAPFLAYSYQYGEDMEKNHHRTTSSALKRVGDCFLGYSSSFSIKLYESYLKTKDYHELKAAFSDAFTCLVEEEGVLASGAFRLSQIRNGCAEIVLVLNYVSLAYSLVQLLHSVARCLDTLHEFRKMFKGNIDGIDNLSRLEKKALLLISRAMLKHLEKTNQDKCVFGVGRAVMTFDRNALRRIIETFADGGEK